MEQETKMGKAEEREQMEKHTFSNTQTIAWLVGLWEALTEALLHGNY